MEPPETDEGAPRWDGVRERRAFLVAGLITALVLVPGRQGTPVALGFLAASWMGSLLLLRYAWIDRGVAPSPATGRGLVALGSGALLCLLATNVPLPVGRGPGGPFAIALPHVFVAMAAAIVVVRGFVALDRRAPRREWKFRAACAAVGAVPFVFGTAFATAYSRDGGSGSSLAFWVGLPLFVWGAGSIPDSLRSLAHVRIAVVAAGAAGAYAVGQAASCYLWRWGRTVTFVVAALMAVLALMVLGAAAVRAFQLQNREDE